MFIFLSKVVWSKGTILAMSKTFVGGHFPVALSLGHSSEIVIKMLKKFGQFQSSFFYDFQCQNIENQIYKLGLTLTPYAYYHSVLRLISW